MNFYTYITEALFIVFILKEMPFIMDEKIH